MIKGTLNVHIILLALVFFILDFNRASAEQKPVNFTLAHQNFANKNYKKVIDQLSPQIEKLDRSELLILAKSYGEVGNSAAAIKTLTAILAASPKDAEAKFLIGKEQLRGGKDREAIQTLKEAIELNPQFEPAYMTIGEIYEKRKNRYELRLLYQDMIEKLGEKPGYLSKLCETSTGESLYDLALKYCRKAIQQSPQDASNYIFLAQSFKDTGDKNQALNYYVNAAHKFPNSDKAQIAIAQYFDEQKSYIKSYQYYKLAIRANKKNAVAWIGLGQASLEIQKYQESIQAFLQACVLDKSSLAAFRKAANSIRTMKQSEWLKKYELGLEKCGLQGTTDKN